MSKRLEVLESLVDTKKVFDVGCDHGILALSLSSSHDVVASDITISSVNKTKKLKEDADANFEVIQSDGLDKLDITPDSTLILAGMGTYTIIKILKKDFNKVPNTLIIQANNNHDILRGELSKLGFYIDREVYLYESRWYTIIRFKKGYKKYSKMQYLIGVYPSLEYLKFMLKYYTDVYNKIPYKHFYKKIKTLHIIKYVKKQLK